MDQNTAILLTTALASTTTALGGAAVMFRFLNNRISGKQDKSACDVNIKNFTDLLSKGHENFKELFTEQKHQGEVIAAQAVSLEHTAKGLEKLQTSIADVNGLIGKVDELIKKTDRRRETDG